jgi:hypothetical protein
MYEIEIGDTRLVFTSVCGERGTTGVREAVVTTKLAETGKLALSEANSPGGRGKIEGWFEDPYDLDYNGSVLRSLSDSECYDAMFPDHPLTRLRETLTMLRHTFALPS